jgi:hypothetical protein
LSPWKYKIPNFCYHKMYNWNWSVPKALLDIELNRLPMPLYVVVV